MRVWTKNLNARNAGAKNESKADLTTKKQRYLCKECRCHYTVSQRGYPEQVRRKAIQLYLEGNGFRRIERILKVSYVFGIIWVEKAGAKLEKVPKKDKKVDALEQDELCVKKHLALERSRLRHKATCWFPNWHSRNKTLPKIYR